jgi:hydroxyacylglutathione hydrolase
MGIKHPLIAEIAKDTYLINEFGVNNMYVLHGSERSLVIDTGVGLCDFKAIVESLTDKPYDVVITHSHLDHVGAIHQFDEVYINDRELPELATVVREPVLMFKRICTLHIDDWWMWDVTEDMENLGNKDTKLLSLVDGQVFDLGNRKVTAYELPTQTPGAMYFIDDYSRIAFTGDCCHPNCDTFIPVSTTLRYLLKLYNMQDKDYDCAFSGHATFGGTFNVAETNPEFLKNLIEAFRSVLRGDAKYGWHRHHIRSAEGSEAGTGKGGYYRVVNYGPDIKYTYMNIVAPMISASHVPDLLWEQGEEHIIP